MHRLNIFFCGWNIIIKCGFHVWCSHVWVMRCSLSLVWTLWAKGFQKKLPHVGRILKETRVFTTMNPASLKQVLTRNGFESLQGGPLHNFKILKTKGWFIGENSRGLTVLWDPDQDPKKGGFKKARNSSEHQLKCRFPKENRWREKSARRINSCKACFPSEATLWDRVPQE